MPTIERTPHDQVADDASARRLAQAHFDMLRSLDYHGGKWDSAQYCAWRVGRTAWRDAWVRGDLYENSRYPLTPERAEQYKEFWGPNSAACVSLCEDLARRGFVRVKTGFFPAFELTERGRNLITAHA